MKKDFANHHTDDIASGTTAIVPARRRRPRNECMLTDTPLAHLNRAAGKAGVYGTGNFSCANGQLSLVLVAVDDATIAVDKATVVDGGGGAAAAGGKRRATAPSSAGVAVGASERHRLRDSPGCRPYRKGKEESARSDDVTEHAARRQNAAEKVLWRTLQRRRGNKEKRGGGKRPPSTPPAQATEKGGRNKRGRRKSRSVFAGRAVAPVLRGSPLPLLLVRAPDPCAASFGREQQRGRVLVSADSYRVVIIAAVALGARPYMQIEEEEQSRYTQGLPQK
ncbi:hypothetical protein HPB51_020807 [Rhipicephalus microplus]|uniref:Uncharacterized protein n=1 Tax=Rhipicephalus microplus TaxID=6941 RepID=A0A9J6DQ48_RHIMP|nr:hypothetical protein HPB51_020807 [Rhipicephalus microplus]